MLTADTFGTATAEDGLDLLLEPRRLVTTLRR